MDGIMLRNEDFWILDQTKMAFLGSEEVIME